MACDNDTILIVLYLKNMRDRNTTAAAHANMSNLSQFSLNLIKFVSFCSCCVQGRSISTRDTVHGNWGLQKWQ